MLGGARQTSEEWGELNYTVYIDIWYILHCSRLGCLWLHQSWNLSIFCQCYSKPYRGIFFCNFQRNFGYRAMMASKKYLQEHSEHGPRFIWPTFFIPFFFHFSSLKSMLCKKVSAELNVGHTQIFLRCFSNNMAL